MEERDGREEDRMLLTREEEASLPLLEPLFARHLDLILETLALHLGSDPDVASLLPDDLTVARLKRSQQGYLLSLLNGEREESAGRDDAPAAEYRDPFGLGTGWHFRTFLHFLTSMQPLAFEAFGTNPRLYHTVWNALLKVIFHNLESALSASLKQREDRVEHAIQYASEARRTLDQALNKQAADEKQRQVDHLMDVTQLAIWRVKMSGMSGLAQEMGTPLNVILGHAESLLERTEDATAQAALQSIVRQVEQLIPLRQQLCTLDHGFRSKPHAPDLKTVAERPQAGC